MFFVKPGRYVAAVAGAALLASLYRPSTVYTPSPPIREYTSTISPEPLLIAEYNLRGGAVESVCIKFVYGFPPNDIPGDRNVRLLKNGRVIAEYARAFPDDANPEARLSLIVPRRDADTLVFNNGEFPIPEKSTCD